jgi:hypothetical protein
MKKFFIKRIITSLLLFSVLLPSFSLAKNNNLKDFLLESSNWQIKSSDCDSWYDYQVSTAFNLAGWQAIDSPVRIYGYKNGEDECSGRLQINNANGFIGLFIYDDNSKSWQKYFTEQKPINNQAQTFVLARAIISSNQKNYGDITLTNNLFINSGEFGDLFNSDEDYIASFMIATTTATTTIIWNNPLINNYQISQVSSGTAKLLPLAINNNLNYALIEIGPTNNASNYLIKEIDKTNLGLATWYSYKKCDCAASRDFPKGTKIKVTNIFPGNNYGKSVIVKINDYGPMEYTGNLIDLDKTAFKKIAKLGSGVVPVILEVIK